jgi:alcohol dehydrogenase class IV
LSDAANQGGTPGWRHQGDRRTVVFRPGLAAGLPDVVRGEGWDRFELLTTERALASAPRLADAAEAVRIVPHGEVPDVAADVLPQVKADRLIALGGGRVIDVAKAVAADRGGEVAAVPTTLSGAEMTAIHRLPTGSPASGGVRPSLVLADPGLMTSAPEEQLRATAMNALAHGADCIYTPSATERSRLDALRGAGLIASSLDQSPAERNEASLALGALMTAGALDVAGFAIHHVISQTVVRVCGTPHAETNAAILPVVMEAMAERAPGHMAALAGELGTDTDGIRVRIEELAGGRRALGALGASRDCIDPSVETAMGRGELEAMTPGEVTADDVRRIIEAAW